MGFIKYISFQNITILFFGGYLILAASSMYSILNPSAFMVTKDERTGKTLSTFKPLWEENSMVDLEAYLSTSAFNGKNNRKWLLYNSTDCRFAATLQDSQSHCTQSFNLTSHIVPSHLWERLEQNKTLYILYHVTLQDRSKIPSDSKHFEIWKGASLISYRDKPKVKDKFYLVKDWPILGQFVPNDPIVIDGEPASSSATAAAEATTYAYFKPASALYLVADWTHWPKLTSPPMVISNLRTEPKSSRYLPVTYTGQLGLTSDKLIRLNRTMREDLTIASGGDDTINYNTGVLPLTISFEPMSLSRWQFNAHIEASLQMQKQIGASEKDTDDLRELFTDTPATLLVVTLLVSVLHMLFDILAFHSDVSFWKKTESMVGLSTRTLVLDLVCQVIILLYVQDEGASILILMPAGVGIFIQIWKIYKAMHVDRSNLSQEVKLSDEYDRLAVNTMSMLLIPLVIAFALYSLVFDKHASFTSWLICSLAGAVYAFGFAMMTPQLFINYKLKSVAHLPFKFFMYKALNTFIDDLFAFIIRMPTMHRAACFRDDLVFFVFLYQRYIYPTDKSRKDGGYGGMVDGSTSTEDEVAPAQVPNTAEAESKKTK